MAIGAAVALFAVGNALVPSGSDAAGLWYVLALGLVLGATGFAIGRVSSGAEPAQS